MLLPVLQEQNELCSEVDCDVGDLQCEVLAGELKAVSAMLNSNRMCARRMRKSRMRVESEDNITDFM